MSWCRQVKTIFTVTYLMFIFICYSIIECMFLKEKVDFKAYLIILAGVLFMQYLVSKNKGKVLTIGLPCILTAAISFFMYSVTLAIINSALNAVLIIFLEMLDQEELNYQLYKDRIKRAILILILGGIAAPKLDQAVLYWIFRFYILFLIFAIISLREARNYCNKIRNNKAAITNISIIIVGIIGTTDYVFSLWIKLFHYFLAASNFILSAIADIVAKVIYGPCMRFFSFLMATIGFKKVETPPLPDNVNDKVVTNKETPPSDIMIKIISLLIVIFIIMLLIKYYMQLKAARDKRISNKLEAVKRESIYGAEKVTKKAALSNFFNKFFSKNGGRREQILYIYRKFQRRMKLREIFKPYMTATQLSNVAKIKIDDYEALDAIKRIYNEAKFSKHEIPKENVVEIKENYDRVKKY